MKSLGLKLAKTEHGATQPVFPACSFASKQLDFSFIEVTVIKEFIDILSPHKCSSLCAACAVAVKDTYPYQARPLLVREKITDHM